MSSKSQTHTGSPPAASSRLRILTRWRSASAGPVGLAAAAHLIGRGLQPIVFERGAAVDASIREWGHVRVFSPWAFDVDPVAADLLARGGWTAPDPAGYPTGDELVSRYLEPLAATPELAAALRLNARVLGVARAGIDKLKDTGREDAPFELLVNDRRGRAPVPGPRGDRRIRHVDAAEPARCRAPGERRDRPRRADRLRHPGRARRGS
jgi:hypothetical protein